MISTQILGKVIYNKNNKLWKIIFLLNFEFVSADKLVLKI